MLRLAGEILRAILGLVFAVTITSGVYQAFGPKWTVATAAIALFLWGDRIPEIGEDSGDSL